MILNVEEIITNAWYAAEHTGRYEERARLERLLHYYQMTLTVVKVRDGDPPRLLLSFGGGKLEDFR